MAKTIDIIIPTYKPGQDFDKLIEMLVHQTVRPHSIIIMNSVEDDGDYLDVPGGKEGDPIQVYNIRKSEFNHGHTRNVAVGHSKADYFVCMTQDAIPCDYDLLRELLNAMSQGQTTAGNSGDETVAGSLSGETVAGSLRNETAATLGSGTENSKAESSNATSAPGGATEHGEYVAMAYARQLPRKDASDIEAITRKFNYPREDVVKTQRDLDEMGIKTFFASNVCCCYDRKIFDKLGGFVDKTDFNEDMMYGAKLIQAGYAIKYCAGAQVFHSHNYTARQQYDRNKQVAISQVKHPEYFAGIKSESEGVKLVKSTASALVNVGKWYKVPELIYISGAKYLGYRAGRRVARKD